LLLSAGGISWRPGERRALLISKRWVQAVLTVFLFGFTVLGILAYRTYTGEPPIPEKVVDANGTTVFTGAELCSQPRWPS
jgi:nitric oxide reductase subunit B